MMNTSPFYRNSKPPQQSSLRSSVPAKKVVSVPVHFISLRDSAAALKIQKVFRGFLVRKSVNNISSIGKEIDKIEERIINKEFVNSSIRDDPKERLRVNETLMSLLFKLDSIRGFDFGVRDFRKSVTKKAIALQEKVDSIADESSEEIDVYVKEENSCDHGGDEIVGKEEDCWQKDDKMMKLMSERNEMPNIWVIDDLRRTKKNKKKKTNTTNPSSRTRIMI